MSAATDAISYALAKQVPDMERGFAIETNYGHINIEAGPGAERIRATVAQVLSGDDDEFLGPSPAHFKLLRNALDHIARTARKSRTSTRRLRWIEKRAEGAIAGEAYTDDTFDLPKSGGLNTQERLIARVHFMGLQRAELLAAFKHVIHWHDQLQKSDIDAAKAVIAKVEETLPAQAKPAALNPAALADAQRFGAGLCEKSLDQAEAV